jgi:hypothetical protein
MGNSPSQQTAEGAQGEPEDFDLNAISDGSGDNKMPPKKNTSSKAASKRKARKPRSSATNLKPTSVSPSPLEDHDVPPAPAMGREMKGSDETSDDKSPDVISVSPVLRASQRKKAGGNKRKRESSFVAETPIEKPKKMQKKQSSPATLVQPAERDLRQESAKVNESVPRQSRLQALERDAELPSPEMTKRPQPSPRLPLVSDVLQENENVSDVETSEDDAEFDESSHRRSIATSVAKRTFPFVVKKAGESNRNLQDERSDSDVAFDNNDSSDSSADSTDFTPSQRATPKPKSKRHTTAQKPGSALKRLPRTPRSARARSQSDFDVEAFDGEVAQNRPSVRQKKTCAECAEVFRTKRLLEEHGQNTTHTINTFRTGVTGRFSDDEVQRLENYKKNFCRIHDITGHQFNDMMTDSCRRGSNQPWSYDFISKQDLIQEYLDVLPNRNRKSMSRFRERNWQNATGNKDWTTEDDEQIIKLVGELGTKWVEIGQALTRTQDAVQQRWKKYLRYRDTRKGGFWSPEETEILERSVAGAKKRSGLSQNSSTDKRIAWSLVSDALNGARTPKQCADHWQFLQESRERKGTEGTLARTPKTSAKKRRKQLSTAYVEDSEKETEKEDQTRSLSENSEQVDDNGKQGNQSPELPPVPSKKTPNKITTLSQAFANTQANTSALRRSQRHSHVEMSDRPSPDLSMRPVLQTPVLEQSSTETDEEEIPETEEAVVTTQEPSTFRLTSPEIAEAGNGTTAGESDSESDEETENDSDDDDEEEEEAVASPRSKASRSAESASIVEESVYKPEPTKPESDSDDDLQTLPEIPPHNIITTDLKKPSADQDDTSSSGESESEDEGDEEEEEEDAADEEAEDGEEDDDSDEETASGSSEDESEDSMEKDTRNDFMESIRQSAQKAALAKQQKKVIPQLEETESESDSDGESIAHG